MEAARKFSLAFRLTANNNESLKLHEWNFCTKIVINIPAVTYEILFVREQLQTWRLYEFLRLYPTNVTEVLQVYTESVCK
jgi:hypothetical protein